MFLYLLHAPLLVLAAAFARYPQDNWPVCALAAIAVLVATCALAELAERRKALFDRPLQRVLGSEQSRISA